MKKLLALFFLSFFIMSSVGPLLGYEVTESHKELSPTTQGITLNFTLAPKEYLYKESLIPSVDNPAVTLSELTSSSTPESFFDETYKKQKEGYTGTATFTTIATIKPNAVSSKAVVHTHFMISSDKRPHEKSIELSFTLPKKATSIRTPITSPSKKGQASDPVDCEPQQPSLFGNLIRKILNYISVSVSQARKALTSLFAQTGSKSVRAVAALLLGIMLSLTPCIYPMIPITIGVLQASGSKSGFQNFLLALSYTLGISITFALLGFIAAVGSCVFGELQGSPFIIMPLAALLFYFGLTMFDLVQLPIPSWLQLKTSKVKGGSKGSAFLFGAISGTVASPCLSPGLVLILNYVTNITAVSWTAYLEGFLLLFIFGVGSSLPLLIIGTFSGSLKMLPKAGAWMIEIKKLVGIMLISMALYHLSHLERLFPWYLFVWVVVLTFVILGIYYFATIKRYDSIGMRRYKNLMGTLLIITACIIGVQGEKALIEHLFPEESAQPWSHDYQTAKEKALSDKKLLFIDIGATYCAACKALDNQIFKQETIQDALALFSLLKVEADIHTKTYEEIKKLYGDYIIGYPTYLMVDPQSEKVLKKWSIDIDQLSLEGVEQAFEALAESYKKERIATSSKS